MFIKKKNKTKKQNRKHDNFGFHQIAPHSLRVTTLVADLSIKHFGPFVRILLCPLTGPYYLLGYFFSL